MGLPETQSLRTSSSGAIQAPAGATPRSLSVELAAGFSTSEHTSARLLLVDRRDHDHGRRHDHGRHGHGRHGPHHPGWPRPYPAPYPVPLPIPGYPSPFPGPLPGERACYPWEIGSWNARRDSLGQWWCHW